MDSAQPLQGQNYLEQIYAYVSGGDILEAKEKANMLTDLGSLLLYEGINVHSFRTVWQTIHRILLSAASARLTVAAGTKGMI